MSPIRDTTASCHWPIYTSRPSYSSALGPPWAQRPTRCRDLDRSSTCSRSDPRSTHPHRYERPSRLLRWTRKRPCREDVPTHAQALHCPVAFEILPPPDGELCLPT